MAEQGGEQILDIQEEENVAKLPEQGVKQVLELEEQGFAKLPEEGLEEVMDMVEEQEVAEILQEVAKHGL